MELVIGWLIFAIIVSVIAKARGRTGFGWFLLSVLFSPLLMFLLVVCLPNLTLQNSVDALAKQVAQEADVASDRVKCPECAELVLREARKCKHCGVALVPQTVFTPTREVRS